jgi:hypothetical protein
MQLSNCRKEKIFLRNFPITKVAKLLKGGSSGQERTKR